jgi:hypothetical protein
VSARPGPAVLAERLRLQALYCNAVAPFYGRLLDHLASDVEAGGPTWALLGGTVDDPARYVPHLGLLAAVHRRVLSGAAPDLAGHYPSTGGDGDADAAWPIVAALLEREREALTPWLHRVPQTNEVGRAAALVGGLLTVAAETGRSLRLLEIGASAGLNLRLDHFRYEAGDRGWGDPASPVRFVDVWPDATPPLEARLVVAERAGCDLSPVDGTSEDGRLDLLAYVWPDQTERIASLDAALTIARRVPAPVERADAFTWLPDRLAEPRPGTATVVFHSIVVQYFTEADQARLADALAAAGSRATDDAPLAWLRLEPRALLDAHAELRLTRWPGGEDRLLARAGFHGGPVRWGDPQAPSASSIPPSASMARRDASA